jgi:hypothetical protein
MAQDTIHQSFRFVSRRLCKKLPLFRLIQGMQQNAGGKPLRFVLYHDGVVPGNNLRPDDGRAFVSFFMVIHGNTSMD